MSVRINDRKNAILLGKIIFCDSIPILIYIYINVGIHKILRILDDHLVKNKLYAIEPEH